MKKSTLFLFFLWFYTFIAFCQQDSNITTDIFRQMNIDAENGFPDAQNALAWLYSTGTYVEKNSQKAFEWWNKAANQGHREAQYSVGLCYAKGEGVEVSLDSAKKYLEKASMQNVDDATELLNKIEEQLKHQQENEIMQSFMQKLSNTKGFPLDLKIVWIVLMFIIIFIDSTTKDLYDTLRGKNKQLLSRNFFMNARYIPITIEMVNRYRQFKTIRVYPDECSVSFCKSSSEKKINTIFVWTIALIVTISILLIIWNISSALYNWLIFIIFILWLILAMAEVTKYNNLFVFAYCLWCFGTVIVTGLYLDSTFWIVIGLLMFITFTLLETLFPFVTYTELNTKSRTISKKIYGIRYAIRPMEDLVKIKWGEKKKIELIFDNNSESWLMRIMGKLSKRREPSKVTYEINTESDEQKLNIVSFIEELFGEVGEMNI